MPWLNLPWVKLQKLTLPWVFLPRLNVPWVNLSLPWLNFTLVILSFPCGTINLPPVTLLRGVLPWVILCSQCKLTLGNLTPEHITLSNLTLCYQTSDYVSMRY